MERTIHNNRLVDGAKIDNLPDDTQGDITSLQEQITNNDSDISSLSSRVTTNEVNISSIQSEQATQNTAIALNTAKRTYPIADETKLAGIEAGAQVNVGEEYTTAEKSKVSNLPVDQNAVNTSKQDTLVSGTNIKTINSESILGAGNIEITGGGSVDSVNGQTGVVTLDADDISDATTTNKFVQQDVVTTLGSDNTTIPTSKAVADAIGSAGGGDMLKSVYDTDNNGIVDNSEALGGQAPSYYLDRTNHTGTQTMSTISDAGALATLDTVSTTEIENDAVTFAKMQNITTNKLIGRHSAGNGDPEEVGIGSNLEISGSNLQAKTGTTSGTVATGNHLHTGVYEPAFTTLPIAKGGTNATTASGARTELGVAYGTTAGTVLEGSKDAEYVKLAGTQTITGAKTFTQRTEFKGATNATSGQIRLTDGSGFLRGLLLSSPNEGQATGLAEINVVNSNADLGIGTRDYNNQIYIKGTTGNVGIGTPIPGAKLDVNGDVLIQGATSSVAGLKIRANNLGKNEFIEFQNDSGFKRIGIIYDNTTPGFGIQNRSGVDLLRIVESTGNVGINKTNPGSKLAVSGLPTSATGLTSGDVWRNGTVLNIIA